MKHTKPKVLLVDDIEVNTLLLEELLSFLEVDFMHANSGKAALELIQQNEFAIALMDVEMPIIDGYKTVELMREMEDAKLLPVIFISAIYSDDYYKVKGIQSGAVDFISKPIVPEILIGKVQVFIDLYNHKKDLEYFNIELKKQIDEREKIEIALRKNDVQIRKSLEEKERLLSEIHHRVKNNMQMVSTMLSLQANYGDKNKPEKAFAESIDRINSMALIHEKLYESKNFGEIEIESYIKELAHELIGAYQGYKKVDLKIDIAPIMLEIDTAITLGLLLNELITNTLKYAFPQQDYGEITISLQIVNTESISLKINDNGVGLPKDFEARKNDSLGMQLISGFSTELGGTLKIWSNNGTHIEIVFKPTKKSR